MQVLDDPRLPLGLPGSQVDDREDHYVSRPDSRQERFPPTLPMGVDLECKKSCLHHLIPEPSSFSGEVQSIRNNPDSAPPLLQVPRERHRARSPSPDAVSLPSSDDFGEFRRPLYWHDASADDDLRSRAAAEAARSKGFKRFLIVSWLRNKGVALVLLSQAFGCLMSVTTRLLEMGGEDEERLDPFQILFARMSITTTFSLLYMWWTKVEHWPLGAREVRPLLVARGLGGFFGVLGLYWSLQYLALADATVISFLGPIIACWLCSKILKAPFTLTQQIAAFVSLIGVVLIAQPTSILSALSPHSPAAEFLPGNHKHSHLSRRDEPPSSTETTPQQRLSAVGMALVGVVGAAVAISTIRWIGHRAHPLISVNYFSTWCTLVSTLVLLFVPSVPFVLPSTPRQWILLAFIGVSGFVMQFLLTAGLRYERSNRATNMTYSQMLFALVFDWAIWGITPTTMSWAGSGLILGSAIVVVMKKEEGEGEAVAEGPRTKERDGYLRDWRDEEEIGLMDRAGRLDADDERRVSD